MSVLDSTLVFSDAQALASKSSGVSTVSTSKPSAGSGNKNTWGTTINPQIGGLTWNCNVNTAMVGAGAAVVASLVTKASASSMSSGSTTLASLTFPAVSPASTRKSVQLTPGTQCLAYLAVVYTASGAKLTSAKFDSWLGLDNEVID